MNVRATYYADGLTGRTKLLATQLLHLIKLRPDKTIMLGCSDQDLMLRALKPHFPSNTLFELISTYGIKIHLRD